MTTIQRMADEAAKLIDQVSMIEASDDPADELLRLLPVDRLPTKMDVMEVIDSLHYTDFVFRCALGIAAVRLAGEAHARGETLGVWPDPSDDDNDPDEMYWKSLAGESRYGEVLKLAYREAWEGTAANVASIATTVIEGLASNGLVIATKGISDWLAKLVAWFPRNVISRRRMMDGAATGGYARAKFTSVKDDDVIVYITKYDGKVRANHLAMHGVVVKASSKQADNPDFWAPKGHGCRCTNQVVPRPLAGGITPDYRLPKAESDPGYKFKLYAPFYAEDGRYDKDVLARLDLKRLRDLTVLASSGMVVDLHRHLPTAQQHQSFMDDFAPAWKGNEDLAWSFLAAEMTKDDMEAHGFNEVDIIALLHYSYMGNDVVNARLRGMPEDFVRSRMPRYSKGRADAMSVVDNGILVMAGAFKKAPIHAGTVYRGANLTRPIVAKYQIGDVVSEPAFLSTSSNSTTAKMFAPSGGGPFNTVYHVTSKTGRVMVASFFDEDEVVFLPGTRFKVLDITVESNGDTRIDMEEL